MAQLELKNIRKEFGDVVAVDNANFVVEDSSFLVLVGPSGCGKSTILRIVAGLEEPTSGDVLIGGKAVTRLQPKDRDIAMVFQSYALYPHMTAAENMSFGLRVRKTRKDEIDRKVTEAAEILGISDLLHRKPAELSGGQKQRVALGRAIVRDPKVFLFDEPLSNLDAKFRLQLRSEIKRLHERLKVTTVYVTHDQVEAMTLGDKIVVMDKGRIQQMGTPSEVFNRPKNVFVGGFIGTSGMNFLDGEFTGDDNTLSVEIGEARVPISRDRASEIQESALGPGNKVVVGIRPENIAVIEDDISLSQLQCPLNLQEVLGGKNLLYLDHNGHELRAYSREGFHAKNGAMVALDFDMNKAHFFDPESGQNLLT